MSLHLQYPATVAGLDALLRAESAWTGEGYRRRQPWRRGEWGPEDGIAVTVALLGGDALTAALMEWAGGHGLNLVFGASGGGWVTVFGVRCDCATRPPRF